MKQHLGSMRSEHPQGKSAAHPLQTQATQATQADAGAALQQAPRSVAQRSRIEAAFGTAGVAARSNHPVQRERSKNPRRQDDAVYSVGDTLEVPAFDLTEHHVVPHARLVKLQKLAGDALDTRPYMPTWAKVTVRELVNLKGGLKAGWITMFNVDPNRDGAAMTLDDLASGQVGRLRAYFERQPVDGAYAEDRREALRLLVKGDPAQSFQGGAEPDSTWGGAYFEWIPGNIVLGPTARTFDQGDGDKLDKELVQLLRLQGKGAQADAAVAADAAIEAAVKAQDQDQVAAALQWLAVLHAQPYTAFDDAQRGHWVLDGQGKRHVTGFAGN